MRTNLAGYRVLMWLACAVLLLGCRAGGGGSGGAGGGDVAPPDGPGEETPVVFACGSGDTPETGVQGDIPLADQNSDRAAAGYNCGLSLVAELDISGDIQGYGHCLYVRRGGSRVDVLDVRNPTQPVTVGSLSPAGAAGVGGSSETMRLVATDRGPDNGQPLRAVLVSGSSVYDVRDCENPVHKGDIAWPGILPWPAGLSHDIRISQDANAVYAAIGVVTADISDLDNPDSWTVRNHTCGVAAQWHPLHMLPDLLGLSLCEAGVDDQAPQISHGPDGNDTGTRMYVGNQGIPATAWVEQDTLRILDLTVDPPRVLDEAPGPGHSIDWFRSANGREYILHANEFVFVPQASCVPHPRPSMLGFAFEAFITEVTGDNLVRRSMLELDINKAEHCQAKLASGQNTQIAYHSVDNPYAATFAMISMGDAGMRLFDIRDPEDPREVAYFNRGALVHAGVSHYDAARGLIYIPGGDAVRILELQPQILQGLGLKTPTDPAYPRYPQGRAARP